MKRKTLGKLKEEAQRVFNKYIRLRDSGAGFFTCVSCNFTKDTSEMNAGHFYPVGGYDGLRFLEDNVNGECAGCNNFDGGHLIGYHDNLLQKIGESRLNELKRRAKAYKMNGHKWTRHDLSEMINKYKVKNG